MTGVPSPKDIAPGYTISKVVKRLKMIIDCDRHYRTDRYYNCFSPLEAIFMDVCGSVVTSSIGRCFR